MTNKYPSKCFFCGEWIEAGEGLLERRSDVWTVAHRECKEKEFSRTPAPRVRKADGQIVREPAPQARSYAAQREEQEATPRWSFPRIVELLNTAKANGQKYPSIDFTLDSGLTLQIRLAGEKSKNPGSVTVTDGRRYPNNKYYGRIMTDGTWLPSRESSEWTHRFLRDLNNDPAKFAGEYGRKTGNCCFCATEITHESSLTVGYGPICADRFGLPHGGY